MKMYRQPIQDLVHRIDAVDEEDLTLSHTEIEGDVLGDVGEKVAYM